MKNLNELLKTIDQIEILHLKINQMKHSPDNPQSTSRKVRTARMNDDEYNYITSRHNGLSAAIRLLTKGGKYEQLVERNTELENTLKNLNK